tara:strand:+ start:359 stop:655 length:297 start_codon:yes stop_codon:yes gene_type:complete
MDKKEISWSEINRDINNMKQKVEVKFEQDDSLSDLTDALETVVESSIDVLIDLIKKLDSPEAPNLDIESNKIINNLLTELESLNKAQPMRKKSGYEEE